MKAKPTGAFSSSPLTILASSPARWRSRSSAERSTTTATHLSGSRSHTEAAMSTGTWVPSGRRTSRAMTVPPSRWSLSSAAASRSGAGFTSSSHVTPAARSAASRPRMRSSSALASVTAAPVPVPTASPGAASSAAIWRARSTVVTP